MRPIKDASVKAAFDNFPPSKRKRLIELRELILDVASASDIDDIEETLKWGEPAYLCKTGSTIRLGWQKKKHPEATGVYFNCQTSLIDTFKELYADELSFEGNRGIVLPDSSKIPQSAIKHCVELSLMYHKIKHLPLLGA